MLAEISLFRLVAGLGAIGLALLIVLVAHAKGAWEPPKENNDDS